MRVRASISLAPSIGPCSLAVHTAADNRVFVAARIISDRVHLLCCEGGEGKTHPTISLVAVYRFPSPVQCVDIAAGSLVAATRDGNLWAQPLATIGQGESGAMCGGVWIEALPPGSKRCFARQPAVRAMSARGHDGGVAVLATSLVAATRGFASNGAAGVAGAGAAYESLEGDRATCVICLRSSDATRAGAAPPPDIRALDARLYASLFGRGGGPAEAARGGAEQPPAPVALQGDMDGCVRWCYLDGGDAETTLGDDRPPRALVRLREPIHAIVPVRLSQRRQAAYDGIAIVTSGGQLVVVEMQRNAAVHEIAHRPRIAAPVLSVCASASGMALLHCTSLGAVYFTAVGGLDVAHAKAGSSEGFGGLSKTAPPLLGLGRAWCVQPCGVVNNDDERTSSSKQPPSLAEPGSRPASILVLERNGRLVWLDIDDNLRADARKIGIRSNSYIENSPMNVHNRLRDPPEVQIQSTLASLGRMSAQVAALTAMNAADSSRLGAINGATHALHCHQCPRIRDDPAPEAPLKKKRRGRRKKANVLRPVSPKQAPFHCRVRPFLRERPVVAASLSCKWLEIMVGPGALALPRDVRWSVVVHLAEDTCVPCGNIDGSRCHSMSHSFHFPLWAGGQPTQCVGPRGTRPSAATGVATATATGAVAYEIPIEQASFATPIVAKVWLSFLDYTYPRQAGATKRNDLGGGIVALLLYSGRLDAADFVHPPTSVDNMDSGGSLAVAHGGPVHWHTRRATYLPAPQRAANALLRLPARMDGRAGMRPDAAFTGRDLLGHWSSGTLSGQGDACTRGGSTCMFMDIRGPLCISVPVSAEVLAYVQKMWPREPCRQAAPQPQQQQHQRQQRHHAARNVLSALLHVPRGDSLPCGADFAVMQSPWRIQELSNDVTAATEGTAAGSGTGTAGIDHDTVATAWALSESGRTLFIQCRASPCNGCGDRPCGDNCLVEIRLGTQDDLLVTNSSRENLLLMREALLYRMQRLLQRALRSNCKLRPSQLLCREKKGAPPISATISALENEVLMLQQSVVHGDGPRIINAFTLRQRIARATEAVQRILSTMSKIRG